MSSLEESFVDTVLPRALSEEEWDTAYKELKELESYQHNWDGENGSPVNPLALEASYKLFDTLKSKGLPIPWTVYLLCSGNIMAEWNYYSSTTVSAEN